MTESVDPGSALLALSNDLAGAVETVGGALVAVHARRHTPSTGIHWRSGAIVTADHTIERDEGISVTLPDGKKAEATVAGRDGGTDLAALKIEASSLALATVGNDGDLKVGHIALAVARPGDDGLSASWGTISGLGGPWRTWSGGQIDRLIRPDLTLYPGFSGGPLIDGRGQIVGVNTSGLSRSMTLTIPASTVNRVVDQLLAKGRVPRGYLGLALQSVRLPDNLISQLSLPDNRGLIVVSVESEGPAEKAGVLVGDILLALNGKTVGESDAVQSALDSDQVGKNVSVRVLRGGQPADLNLTIGERPRRGE
jgi:S1-C subfamily serine protease